MDKLDFLGERLFKDDGARKRGKKGGATSSRRKRQANRLNGAKGGWKAMDDFARMRFKIDRANDPRFHEWGRMGGKRSSARKREASRTNGLLGGRPKKEESDGA